MAINSTKAKYELFMFNAYLCTFGPNSLWPGPEVIKLFSCSTQLSMIFSCS